VSSNRLRTLWASPPRALRAQWTWIAIVAGLALAVRVPLFFVRAELFPGGDSRLYLTLAQGIPRGEFEGMFRTPGYPAFLWLVGLLPGRTEDAAVIVQHLLGVGLAAGLVTLGWRLFSPAAGVLAGAIAALSRVFVGLEDLILADFLFGLVAFAGAAALAIAAAARRDNYVMFVLAGVLFGLAAYVKPVGQALILAAPVAFALSSRDLRRTLLATGLVVAAMVVTVTPWVVRNEIAFDDARMSNQLGITLFNRAFEVERLPVPLDDPQGPVASELTAAAFAEPGLRPSSYVHTELSHRGFSSDEALEIERRLATTAIKREPWQYLGTSGTRIADGIEDLDEAELPDRLGEAPAVLRHPSEALLRVSGTLSSLWFLASAHLLVALVLLFVPGPSRPAAAAFIGVALLILIATVLTHGGMPRYSLQVAPETWLVGSAGLIYVIGAVASRIRGEPKS